MAYDFEKERDEAYEAGLRARASLENALKELNSARNWGIYDIFGGGFISSIIKHSKMNKASAYIEETKANLQAFSRELGDIGAYADIDVTTGDFWGFSDWFFDGFLSDWIMQDRIKEALIQVQRAITKVTEVLEKLNR